MRIFVMYKSQEREIGHVKAYNLAKVIRTLRINDEPITRVECSAIADRYWVEDIRATCANNNVPCTVVHEEFPA